ncbi:MAG: 2,3,4,5-tetrahydropyridine-2,6-dicarboxylate N-succinyltransferase [Bifidobacteriaceae bacterium]|jgi:2,3,4,5-tetrahydropyridine-2-carboxylate N-succinyltransferase|nr:2,3,4,5-tetrahydropyridine-2,6-dicarboxylate N-succinyltransferase [Bifidobacteriaceae bacterium]
MSERLAWGIGLAWTTPAGQALDWWCPEPRLGAAPAGADRPGADRPGAAWPGEADLAPLAGPDPDRGLERVLARAEIDLDAPPGGVHDAYLRLHLLSHRLVKPNELNLEGIFTVLPNVVWTSAGPCPVEGFEDIRRRLELAGRGPVRVHAFDRIPAMADYVVPSGVRVADASRVRLGAHLAPGTTVMHEGFVNFNAGTLGPTMIEGRISQGVVVSGGSDVGGGASIMGTLSGGGKVRIGVGPRSLVGANAGIGISLGADCVVEAGLYLTAGAKVLVLPLPDAAGAPAVTGGGSAPADSGAPVVKAAELSGQDGWLFRRNSLSGAIEAVPRRGAGAALRADLHAH